MSDRLGKALASYIARLPGEAQYIIIEGIPEALAGSLARAWRPALPQLAIVSGDPDQFGRYALRNASGTGIRNSSDTGVVLVLCEGQQIPDRQSVRSFFSLSPSDLLKADNIDLLMEAPPSLTPDGALRQVRQALVMAEARERPTALAVASYLDAVAAGADPLKELPILGGFTDLASSGQLDAKRIIENLRLASSRRSDELIRPADLPEIRKRALRIFERRRLPSGHQALVDDFMKFLEEGSDAILSFVTFDEAREIIQGPTHDLAAMVKQELRDYEQLLSGRDPAQAQRISWTQYHDQAQALRKSASRRDAAKSLLDFDNLENRGVFEVTTRRKLESLLRDRAIQTRRSCPEAALVAAIQALATPLERLRLISPSLPITQTSRTGARNALVLAVARLRLGALMRHLQETRGIEVDGLLLRGAQEDITEDIFADAALHSIDEDTGLPPLKLSLRGQRSGGSIEVHWVPDLDDVGLLRSLLVFSQQETLHLSSVETSLVSFCSRPVPSVAPVPQELRPLSSRLKKIASRILLDGVTPKLLASWPKEWSDAVAQEQQRGATDLLGELVLAGALVGQQGEVALTPLSPLKSEWLSAYIGDLWALIHLSVQPGVPEAELEHVQAAAAGIERATATHYPPFLRVADRDRPLLPSSESRLWSVYGGVIGNYDNPNAEDAIESIFDRLIALQPEVEGHLRCIAYGPGSSDLLVRQGVRLVENRGEGANVRRIEIFCIGNRPHRETLAYADAHLSRSDRTLGLRYLPNLGKAADWLRNPTSGTPGVHLALVTGLTAGGNRLLNDTAEVPAPKIDPEVLFAPRTWLRPQVERRLLLMPPAATEIARRWLQLATAIDDGWPDDPGMLRIPEIRTDSRELSKELKLLHDLAMWVATLDRYATRDSLEVALGPEVAILHQERRLGGESPLGLVISQKAGGPADRAIGRSLRSAGIVNDPEVALSIGRSLREVASQGYGILALQAATTGSGINELVGHVVAFSLLASRTTPWPLRPGCRVLLVPIDEYSHWFQSGKRVDLLALAIDTVEIGIHVAAIEVKARRSDSQLAATQALEQIRHTLRATRYAAYPEPTSIQSRLWLNRIAEAAYSVARESRAKLSSDEIEAIEAFRLGSGTLEWAGFGLVFGPKEPDSERHFHQPVAGDRIPIVIHSVLLTEELLRKATGIKLTSLRTVEATRQPLQGGRTKRRPETGVPREPRTPSLVPDSATAAAVPPPTTELDLHEPTLKAQGSESLQPFSPPILGWDIATGEAVRWPASGEDAKLPNGHIEIWGSSGAGKTQFTMSLLAQLAKMSGAHFGIADFKNDYGGDFPKSAAAEFIDLWNQGAPYNPLALDKWSDKEISRSIIELRDTVDVAARSFTRMGHRQLEKLRRALTEAYEIGKREGRWPTLSTLDSLLDSDIAGVVGDLTRHPIFREGPPLGSTIEKNVIFGLSQIPGNGLTTILAAGFILSALLLKVQDLPPVSNTIRYLIVVDEAHRVSDFRSIDTMIREGRSKGLAVFLATQQPGDLPSSVSTNAQTKICFRLPDATVATAASKRLDPADSSLSELIRTLRVGEAFVSLGGSTPRLLAMAQLWKDAGKLNL